MRDAQGEVTGVLQALNKHVGVFTDEDAELLSALGGQAAGAIENALLHDEINRLFEGFVSASVVAIESRDPTTAGHSGRVASLTVGLAEALEHQSTGPYARVRFGAQDVQEMRYASLLHDFGKVGVREHVLVKAEKLYPQELDVLRARFALARKDRQLRSAERRLDGLPRREAARRARAGGGRAARRRARTSWTRRWSSSSPATAPPSSPPAGSSGSTDLGRTHFRDEREIERPLLLAREVERLSIPRGSLSAEERLEIESHVSHTFRFLSQIPVDPGAEARAGHRLRPPRAAERHRLSAEDSRRDHPGAVEDDGHLGRVRRADRRRPAVQEGRAPPGRARHPPPGGEERDARRGAAPHLRRGRGAAPRAAPARASDATSRLWPASDASLRRATMIPAAPSQPLVPRGCCLLAGCATASRPRRDVRRTGRHRRRAAEAAGRQSARRPSRRTSASSPTTCWRGARPGSVASSIAAAYVASQLQGMGLEPAGDGRELVPAGDLPRRTAAATSRLEVGTPGGEAQRPWCPSATTSPAPRWRPGWRT